MPVRTARLVFVGGRYDVTGADRLWLTRAVEAEGPPQLGVAQALVNGFCAMQSKGRWRKPLADWVRAYAQPVNPRWYVGGDLYLLAWHSADASERLYAQRAAHAREVKHSARTQFSAPVLAAVQLALSTTFASDVTDYAAPHIDATGKGYVPRSAPLRGINRMWSRLPGWTGYTATESPLDVA